MTQFLLFPCTQVTPWPETPCMEPESRVASSIVCPHKGQQSLSAPDLALRSRLQLYPAPLPRWGCLPSRLAGFRLNRARRRLWASVLRNWGMPSFALQQPPGLIKVQPHPRGPISPPHSVQV